MPSDWLRNSRLNPSDGHPRNTFRPATGNRRDRPLNQNPERHTMTDTHIREQWHRLPSPVTQWLMDNPGCLILPRTLSAEISAATGESLSVEPHGETSLCQEDIDFIRMKSHQAESGESHTEYQFFDSVQP